jgi:hypothetical protein
MPESHCECCDLPVKSCGKAAEREQRRADRAERERLQQSGWTPAQYAGTCHRCGEWFPVDSLIRYDGDGWRSECCHV